ncbi:hypothetical protein VNI00_000334 [Paramarasmius palmivorus]|uniref:AAA+ ATPase domain-containing protein n=1 Tax=Paramarasmius palmivorus TaxID=297713 RepID=A0AAW0EEG0_9AGAR
MRTETRNIFSDALPYTFCEDDNFDFSPKCVPVGPKGCVESLSEAFITRHVWTSTDLAQNHLDDFGFDELMLSEVYQAVSYAFSCGINTADTPRCARTVTLYAPYHGGNPMVDAVVKAAAINVNADVLVLDALELAAGKCGSLGDAGALIDEIYNSLPIKTLLEDTHVQRFLDHLIETGLDISPPAPLRRILYLRDFGTISRASLPLMIHLIRAINRLRLATPRASTFVIVIGGCHPLGYPGRPDRYSMEKGFCNFSLSTQQLTSVYFDHQTLLKEGNIPRDEMPHFDNKIYVSEELPLVNLSSAFFAPILAPYSDRTKELFVCPQTPRKGRKDVTEQDLLMEPLFWQEQVKVLAATSLAFSVYPKTIDVDRQREEIQARASAVNAALLKLLLSQKGVIVVGEIIDAFGYDLYGSKDGVVEYSLLSPSSVEAIYDTLVVSLGGQIPSPVSAKVVIEAVRTWNRHYERLDSWINRENQRSQPDSTVGLTSTSTETAGTLDPVIEAVRNSWELPSHEKKLLSCVVDPRTLSTAFQDVCLDRGVIENLRSIVSLPLLYPQQFKTGILSRESLSGALLYGPPGTGKTMVCRALACESGARMLLVKPSDVFNMYVGESEKYAKAVFNLAERLAPCIVFIDEVDSLFGARCSKSGGRDVHRAMLTEFMQCMDGLQSKDKGIIVIGATNRPYDLDPAILRRLPCRMLVDLPDEHQRKNILQSHLKGELLHDIDLSRIATQTEGYSGSDLKNLCVSAAMEGLKDSIGGLGRSSAFDFDGRSTAAAAADKSNHEEKPIPPQRIIRMDHFWRAFTQVTASFTFEGNKELYEWHQKYGSNPDEVSLFAKRCQEENLKGSPPPSGKSEYGGNVNLNRIPQDLAKSMLTLASMLSGMYNSG